MKDIKELQCIEASSVGDINAVGYKSDIASPINKKLIEKEHPIELDSTGCSLFR